MKFLARNNVRCYISRSVSPSDDEIYIFKANAPYRNPPTPDNEHLLRLTIRNANGNVDKIEIVEVNAITEANAVEWRLDVERGKEGTGAFSFSEGDVVYLANTEEAIQSKANVSDVLIVERTRVNSNGEEDPAGDFEAVSTIVDGKKIIILSAYT